MMEEDVKGLADYLDLLRRRKWQMVLPAALILVVGVTVAFVLPPTYRSEATILIEQQEIPRDFVQSTITTFADQRIQIISQRVMTSANLVQVIEKFNLYAEEREAKGLATVLEGMREDIDLDMVSADVVDPRTGRASAATIAFRVSFKSESAATAQRVTNELVSLYLNENLKFRTATITETKSFLREEAARLDAEVTRLENALTEFRTKNANYLPEIHSVNLQQLTSAERDISDIKREIGSTNEQKIFLEAQLAQTPPNTIAFSQGGGSAGSGVTQLQALRAQYAEAVVKYSDKHPDIGRLERLIASLESEFTRQTSSGDTETESPVAPVNPAYIQLQTQLHAADIELQSLKLREAEVIAKASELEGRLARSPHVEKELSRLQREYNDTVQDYREIRAKERAATLSESMERGQKGERLSLIEPAQRPSKPEKPNRQALLFLSVFFSLAGGVGFITVLEMLDTTLHTARELVRVVGSEPLSVIPYNLTRAERRVRVWKRVGFATAGAGAITVGIAFVHLQYMPLGTLWFVVVQRLGIQTG